MELIDGAVGSLAELVTRLLPEGALRVAARRRASSAAWAACVVFLPQIFMLFFFIAVLEDCGYMARAAYLMDKLMARIGLSAASRSFRCCRRLPARCRASWRRG